MTFDPWRAGQTITADQLNDDVFGPWYEPTFNEWQQGDLGYQPLRVGRDGARGYLDGHARPVTTFTADRQIACVLPAGMRPLMPHFFEVPQIGTGDPYVAGCKVDVNGEVAILTGGTLDSSDNFDFTHVSWPLD